MKIGNGVVYLVGAGPGDEGLMTIKGMSVLKLADVVMYDALSNQNLLNECKKSAELIDVGKCGSDHHLNQQDTNMLLIKYAMDGKYVVRLKGGDPFLFGRGGEEAEELRRAGIEVHVIPGVTSPISIPELVGIPITHRNFTSSVTFVTGHEKDDRKEDRVDWKTLAKIHGTLVILMGIKNAENISQHLIDGGMDRDTPAAIICNGSTPEQIVEITTVSGLSLTIDRKKLGPPGIIVIGNVVKFHSILGDLG